MPSITNLEQFDKDQHLTPPEIFQALNCTFDLDVCGYPNSYVTARSSIILPDDGLTSEWYGMVWMNPPYSKPSPWIERFLSHNNGIAIVPVSRGKWWDKIWDSEALIIPSPYNFKFIRPDGVTRDIRFRTMLFALGEGKPILASSKLGKCR